MRRQSSIEIALKRRSGMDPRLRVEFGRHLEAQTDWRGKCQVCGADLVGSIAELAQHQHEEEDNAAG